jgi:hypothetical protein
VKARERMEAKFFGEWPRRRERPRKPDAASREARVRVPDDHLIATLRAVAEHEYRGKCTGRYNLLTQAADRLEELTAPRDLRASDELMEG